MSESAQFISGTIQDTLDEGDPLLTVLVLCMNVSFKDAWIESETSILIF